MSHPVCCLKYIDLTIHKFILTPENTLYNESIFYAINNEASSFSQKMNQNPPDPTSNGSSSLVTAMPSSLFEILLRLE